MGRRTTIRHLSATQLELLKFQMSNVIPKLSRQQIFDLADLFYDAARQRRTIDLDIDESPIYDIRV